MTEWKTIEGYPSYEVSDKGQVRSLYRNHSTNGSIINIVRILKPVVGKGGYLQVGLSNEGERRYYKIHRLVLEAFVVSCPERKECNHKNGIKSDNRPENLEWATKSENQLHAYQTGLKFGIPHHERSVHQFTLNSIWVDTYKSAHEAFRQTGVHQGSISHCCNGTYGHLTAGGFIWRFVNNEEKNYE